MKRALALVITFLLVPVGAQRARAGEGGDGKWDAAGAAAYLDARMELWFANGTKLKTGDSQTACVSCHAGVPSSNATLEKGVRWLEANQRPSAVPGVPGRAWPSHSLNYNREQGGEKGEPWRRLFTTDTATAFAILALAD